MSNKTAALKWNLNYTDNDGQTIRAPANGQETVNAPYQSDAQGSVDVPDTTPADTEYSVPFGAVDAAATYLEIENRTGADLKVKVNGPTSATGTLVAGTKDIALVNAAGDHLVVVAGAANGGTPGVLSVKRKSGTEVTVQSWLAGTGLQAADVSDVTVYNYKDGYPMQLGPSGLLLIAGATAPAAGKVLSAKVKTTATQSGAGTVGTRVFGDPT